MPVYVYHCDSCDKDFEATQRMSDAPLTDCSCGAKGTVHRVITTGAGIIFKGSGFYITDYKNKGGSNGSSSESKTSSESSSASAHSCGSGCGCASK